MERALWTQNLRVKNNPSSKRYEFQTDRGFRKFFKTRCELGGMKPINIEKFMGHSTGISDSYYKATEEELLSDYISHMDNLLIHNESKIQKQLVDLMKEKQKDSEECGYELKEKKTEIIALTEKVELDDDAISALSDRIVEISKELESLKSELKLRI